MELSHRLPLISKPPADGSPRSKRPPAARTVYAQSPTHFTRLLLVCLVTFVMATILAGLWLLMSYYLGEEAVIDLKGLEVEKCPACAGQSVCSMFLRGDVKLGRVAAVDLSAKLSGSTLGTDGLTATFGLFQSARQVYLHRIGSPSTAAEVDAAVCRRGPQKGIHNASPTARSKLTCIPHLAIWRWLPTNSADSDDTPFYGGSSVDDPLHRDLVMAPYVPSDVQEAATDSKSTEQVTTVSYAPATRCASDRLFSHLQSSFRERTSYGAETRWLRFDELMFLFNIAIDPTGLLMQAFPPSDGWPFPKYVGACGRWIVHDHHGVPIDRFLWSPIWLRLRILANILQLPERLRHPPAGNTLRLPGHFAPQDPDTITSGYTIYLPSLGFLRHLLVDPYTYDVTLTDLRQVIIVDVQMLSTMQSSGVEPAVYSIPASVAQHIIQSNSSDCRQPSDNGDAGGSTPPCLTPQYADELCSHPLTDHNEWTVCAALWQFHQGGLLDDLPGDLIAVLQKCASPDTSGGRIALLEQAKQLLQTIIERTPLPNHF